MLDFLPIDLPHLKPVAALIHTHQLQPPRVSVLFLAYNQERTVEAAARSVLEQDFAEPLEIIFSDDGSTDETFRILSKISSAYKGPNRVRARRNERNLGIGEHYNVLLAQSAGQLLITAAGDDISVCQRVRRLVQAWDATEGRVDLIASHLVDLDHEDQLGRIIEVDDLAQWHGADDWAQRRPYIVGAAHAFTRRLWDRFGMLDPKVVYEDQVITLRAILSGGAITVPEPLVYYRRGGASALHTFDDGEMFLRRSRLLNERALVEQAQQLSDARAVGHESMIRVGLANSMAREQLIHVLLTESSMLQVFKAMRVAKSVPLSWRWRKWFYLRYPGLGATVRRIQYFSKQLRGNR
jgi:glycosyltransferase involved in cell wall biosynthesis